MSRCMCVCVNECIKHFLFPFEPKVSDCVVETLCRNMQNYNMYNDWNWTSAQKAIAWIVFFLLCFCSVFATSIWLDTPKWEQRMLVVSVKQRKPPLNNFLCESQILWDVLYLHLYSTGQLLRSYTSACNKFLAVHDVISALWVIISRLSNFPLWLIFDASWPKWQIQTFI